VRGLGVGCVHLLSWHCNFVPKAALTFTCPLLILGSCAPEPKDDVATIYGQTYVFPAKEEATVSTGQHNEIDHVRVTRYLSGQSKIEYTIIYDIRQYEYQSKYKLPWLFSNNARNKEDYMKDVLGLEGPGGFYCDKKSLQESLNLKISCGSRIDDRKVSWTAAFGVRDIKFRDLIRKEAIKALEDYRTGADDKNH
jgi:hypothetical protein